MFEIPVDSTLPSFTQRVTLEGTPYLLTFRWNSREEAWYMHVGLDNATNLETGVKLVFDSLFLRRNPSEDKPPGNLLLIDAGASDPPGRYELGTKAILVYEASA